MLKKTFLIFNHFIRLLYIPQQYVFWNTFFTENEQISNLLIPTIKRLHR